MFEKVRKLIAEQLNISEDKVTPETKIVEDLGADSLDMVEMLMTLEEEFGIEVPDEEAANLKQVSDLVAFIEKNSK